jgi:hypothetical protein
MIACSSAPHEFIIGMNFNSPEEVEQRISSNIIDHWVLYDVIGNYEEMSVVYEKKFGCVLVDKMEEVYALRNKKPMTEEELCELCNSCVLENEEFDYYKYEEEIKNRNGAWFYYNNDERHDVYDESMINYMREQGFIVYDDPFCEEHFNGTGWVVFPDTKKIRKIHHE